MTNWEWTKMGIKRVKGGGVWGEKKVKKTISLTPEVWAAIEADRLNPGWKRSEADPRPMSLSTFLEASFRQDYRLKQIFPDGGFRPPYVEDEVVENEPEKSDRHQQFEYVKYLFDLQEYFEEYSSEFQFNPELDRLVGYEHYSGEETDDFLHQLEIDPCSFRKIIEARDERKETTYSSFTGEEEEEEIGEDFSQGIIRGGIDWLTKNNFLLSAFNGEAWEQHPEGRTIPPIAPGSLAALAPIYLVKKGKFGTKIQNLPVQDFVHLPFIQTKLKKAWAKLTSAQRLYSAEHRQKAILNRMESLSEHPPAWVEALIKDDESRIAQIHFWAIAQMRHDAELLTICWESLRVAATKKLKLPDRPTQEVAERSRTVAGFGG
jgi:hypothetical protein